MIVSLTPFEVKTLIDSNEEIKLIDVRELWEYQIAKIEGSELIPLSDFVYSSKEFNKDDKYIIYCHKGVRSYSICQYLVQNGFKNVINLEGGIDAWAREVDSSVEFY